MSYISQKNDYDVCEGPDRAILNVIFMHAVNCCSNLRDPKCPTFTIRHTHTQMFDYKSITFHPVLFNLQ